MCCWEVASFLEWNVWGMTKEWMRVVFQIGSLSVIDGRGKIDWRGLDMIWENNCFLRLSDKGPGLQLQKKEKKKPPQTKPNKRCCEFIFATRGGAKVSVFVPHPVSLTKIWSLQSYIINVSQMAEGLASSVLSDTYLKPVCNFLMFSGCALIKSSHNRS